MPLVILIELLVTINTLHYRQVITVYNKLLQAITVYNRLLQAIASIRLQQVSLILGCFMRERERHIYIYVCVCVCVLWNSYI